MSISSALQAAKTGLLLNGQRADTTAVNVANANTPGYVRRSVSIGEQMLDGATVGVKSNGISRAANPVLTETRRDLSSDLAMAQTLSAGAQRLSRAFGNDSDGTGLFAAYQGLETALSRSVQTPESRTNLQASLDAAGDIVNEFRALAGTAREMRAEADREIANGVETVNGALQAIEDLNGRISGLDQDAGKAAGLMDERDRLLDQIAEYIPVTSIDRGNGNIDVVTSEGAFLLVGTAREIEFTPGTGFGADQSLQDGNLSGLTVDGVELTSGATSYAAVSSGRFAALFTLRDTDIPAFTEQVDALAGDLVSRFASDTVDPTKPADAFGLFVDPDPAAGPGLAERLELNAAVDPARGGELRRLRDGLGSTVAGPAGDSSILQGLSDALTRPDTVPVPGFTGRFSASGAVAEVASLTGQSRIRNESLEASMQTQYGVASEAELSFTSVDVDAEMQDLLLIEQAYAANARVIQTVGQMVDQLIQL